MAPRKTSTAKIDPIAVIAIALKQVKTAADYNRIGAANTQADLEAAWQTLSASDQTRIQTICNSTPQPDINAIAQEIIACGCFLELQAVKAQYSAGAVKEAWLSIPATERQRIKALCDNGHKAEEPQPVTEQSATSQAEPAQPKTRSLFSISDDIEKLNELLDECGDDAEQQELIAQWFEQLGSERDTKLDAYAALIAEMVARAEVRKAEAKRLTDLATTDEHRARLLKERLKWFFDTHNIRTVETARYKLSLAKNGGKAPLILKDGLSPNELPEQFQKLTIDPNTAAIREALERGEKLDFAQLGERGTSLRIK